ncbi:DeoR/GlpR family DNA-binding transcription regulator [Naumannella cuiyingiana]|uniref:DeoR family glycerol-3-phosphate regulon repressor n=1 Tax=Naumannella cuiyingiana TaxID=1347891 RepID=A0A7Z0IJH9_9ACTN|nr:DeoR/GlpR family DNA-binding transcription regulator [Naumannella cuiyingiana]NYI69559.1 DeoR family glycerol-3-phosphate regulon repressor [Naumannella cuiyingiana]
MNQRTRTMIAAERQAAIMQTVRERRIVRVSDLADDFEVSPMTIRRDIDGLHEQGLLERVHGGARLARHGATEEPRPGEKARQQQAEKAAIAEAALAQIQPGQAVGLSAGTTTLALARLLGRVSELTVVTNSVPIAEALRQHAGASTVLTGGQRTVSDALVGPIAVSALRQLHIDLLFVGVHGIDERAGFTTPNMLEADANRAFLESARRRVVLADHSKWGLLGISSFAGLDDVDEVISDVGLDQGARALLADGVGRLTLVDPGAGEPLVLTGGDG